MDSLRGLQQRIVSPALTAGRSPSPEPVKRHGWFRRSRPLAGRHHSAPSASSLARPSRSTAQPPASQRDRERISVNGLSAPGSTRASSPLRTFPDCISDVIIPVPVQMPVDDYNLYKSSGAQSFCSTSKVKFVALPQVPDTRSPSTSRCGSRAVALCGERYVVTPIAQQMPTPKPLKSAGRARPLSEQQQRFEEGGRALARCRVLKRTAEILPHRMDRLYYMSGLNMSARNRYAVDHEALRRMQNLAIEARGGKTPSPVGSRQSDREDEDSQRLFTVIIRPTTSKVAQGETPAASASVFLTEGPLTDRAEAAMPALAPVTKAGPKPATEAVQERRRLLFGQEERPRPAFLQPDESQRRITAMHERFKQQEDKEGKEMEVQQEDEEEEEEDEDEDEVSSISNDEETEAEERRRRIEELMKKKAGKKFDFDRSVFKGVRYTPHVHFKEDKQHEFRTATSHLVVKQDNNVLYVEPNMDEAQAAAFSRLFAELDSDGDGRVELPDLKVRLFQHLRGADLALFLRVFDLNNDRCIDKREFLAVASLNDKLLKQRTTAVTDSWNVDLEKLSYYITVYREMFSACDLDRDGLISLEDLMVIIAASLDEKTGTDIDLMEDILQAIDRDGNGHIDFAEYLTFIPMFLQIHNYLMKKPMLVEDIEKARRLVRVALEEYSPDDAESESSASNIWDD